MIELYHYYSLDSKWFSDASKRIGAKLIDNRIAIMPKNFGHGEYYFTNVAPGVSIVLMDVVFTTEVVYKRPKSEEDFYILQFDLSEEINDVIVHDAEEDELKLIKTGFSILSSQVGNSFRPLIGKRVLALRMIVDKKLLNEGVKNVCKVSTCTEKACVQNLCKGNKEIEINCLDKNIFIYNNIDSKSKVLIHSIKEKSVFDVDFDLFLKGIALKLLGLFIDNYTTIPSFEITRKDSIAVLKTKNYLLGDLYAKFPTVSFLANMAGMSVTKYKPLFRNAFGMTPNQFFMREKLILAEMLLKSKEFSTVTEVARSLGYTKNQHFSDRYFELFGRLPADDFVKVRKKKH